MSTLAIPDRQTARRAAWMPWIFVIGMAVVVAVNSVLIYAALHSWSGVVVSKPYERGLAYNEVLKAAESQEALGWALKAGLRQDSSGAELVIEAADRERRPLEGLAIDVALERPVGPPDIQRLVLVPAGAGRYAVRLGPMHSGLWDARIKASNGADRVLTSQRLTLK